ncbi:MAG: YrzE family protein [Actinomycetota bacterium]
MEPRNDGVSTETYRDPTTGEVSYRTDPAASSYPPNPAPTRSDRPVTERPSARDERVVRLEARSRFGGISFGGSLAGMLTALAATLVLGGLVGAAIGGIAYETGVEDAAGNELTIGSVIAGIAVLFLAFAIGGWVAGRIARYDGLRNGAMVAVWFLALGAILTALGAWAAAEYNVLVQADLPNWFDRWFTTDQVTAGAVISGIVAIVVAFIGGMLGALWGERYHRKADRYLVERARVEHEGAVDGTDRTPMSGDDTRAYRR